MSTITPNLTAGMSRSTAISQMREMARAKVGDTAADALTTLGELRDVLNVDAPPEYSIYNYEPGSTARAKVNAYHNSVSRISMLNYIFDQSIGLFIDPSDLSTLFQDGNNTPITTPGQAVGLALDKSQGLVRGAEALTNYDFSAGSTGWTVTNSDTTHIVTFNSTAGTCRYQSDTITPVLGVNQSLKLIVGKFYEITTVCIAHTSGSIKTDVFSTALVLAAGVGTTVTYGVASSTTFSFVRNSANVDLTISSVSVRELPGNHAMQATSGSRPIYGIHPISGRRNLLTYTEEFDNVSWTKGSASITPNVVVAPDGTTTADKFVPAAAAIGATVAVSIGLGQIAHTFSFYAKANEQSSVSLVSNLTGTFRANVFNLSTVTATAGIGWTTTITDVGNGWYRCACSATADVAASKAFQISNNSTGWTGNGASGVFIWGAQLETGSTATAYQKATTQYNVTEAGVASVGYLAFDGSNDFLVTPSINFSATDKMTVFAGVRKISDAATAIVAELSVDINANNGTFNLATSVSSSGDYQSRSKGTTASSAVSGNSFAAPITSVVTGLSDISGDVATLRVNGVQVATSSSDQGTGNYGNYPLYIGMRAGTSLPFNGYLYNLIVVGKPLTSDQIYAIENYVNSKTGAY
jgi:hypothetical protein